MSNEVYTNNFAYRPPVEPTKEVEDVALIFGSVEPPPGQPTMRRWAGVPRSMVDGRFSPGRSW